MIFTVQVHVTAVRWFFRAEALGGSRMETAQVQYLREATNHLIDRIAAQVGFGSPTAFRDRFKRIIGTSPHAYRAAFQKPTD